MARTSNKGAAAGSRASVSASRSSRPVTAYRAKFLERALLEFSSKAVAVLDNAAAKKRDVLNQVRENAKKLRTTVKGSKISAKKRHEADNLAAREGNVELDTQQVRSVACSWAHDRDSHACRRCLRCQPFAFRSPTQCPIHVRANHSSAS